MRDEIDIGFMMERAKEYHRFNWLEEADKLYRKILVAKPDHAEAMGQLGDIALRVNKPEVASVFFENALKADPASERYREALASARKEAEARARAGVRSETPEIFAQTGIDCVFDRRINSVENKLFLLIDKVNSLHEALIASRVFDQHATEEAVAGMMPVERVDKKAARTLIAFGGMAQGLSMPPKEFFKTLVHEDINIVFVKDFRQCWYQKGLLGLTTGLEDTTAYLRRILPETTEKLITLGASAGGYAAIRFGLPLNADRIIAFSPQTLIDEETARVFAKNRMKELPFGHDDLDLKKVFERYAPKGEIEVHYGSRNNRDRIAVGRLEGLVQAIAYDTDAHMLAAHLKATGELKRIIESIGRT